MWLQSVKKNPVKIFNRVDFILDYCKGKNVLHVGFSDHPFTVKKIEDKTLLHLSLKQAAGNKTTKQNRIIKAHCFM